MRSMRLTRAGGLCLIIGLALTAFPALAGDDSWTVTGSPAGGNVAQVLVNPVKPSILYATSGPGVFKSTDSGASWALVFPTLNEPDVLVMDPQDPDVLYAAYSGDSTKTLFRSGDGGATWEERDEGIGTVEEGTAKDWIGVIGMDPVNAGVMYAATGNTGTYKTSDGGQHWHAINDGLSQIINLDSYVNRIVVDPVTPNVVYLAAVVMSSPGSTTSTSVAGLYKSTDSGAHWHQTGLTGDSVWNFRIDPADHTHLYNCQAGNLQESTDSGATWSSTGTCQSGTYSYDPADPQHMLVAVGSGLLQTTDGTSFTPVADVADVNLNSVVFDPVHPSNVYAGSYAWGVFKSTDGGSTWSQSSTGIHNVVPNLMFEGGDGVIYLASAGSGVYKSADQGVSWSEAGGGVTGSLPVGADFVYALVEDPSAHRTLYAGSTEGLYKTVDGGDTWTESDTGMPSMVYILALAIDPQVPSTLYAGTNTGSGTGLYKSVDGGATWADASSGVTISPDGGLLALAVDPHHSDVVYAGAFETGLFKSTDGGKSWKSANQGIGVTDVWALAVDPEDSKIVYASTSNGFFKSTDAGATWSESDSGLNGYIMTDIQIDPVNNAVIYVSPRYGIGDSYVSPDAGADWFALSQVSASAAGAHATESVQRPGAGRVTESASSQPVTIGAVAVDPRHHTRIFGGGSDGQIYTYDALHLPQPGSSSGGSGGGGSGGSGGGAGSGSSGGGGALGFIPLGLLLGLAALRRRR